MIVASGAFICYGVFLKPMAAEFDWTRAMTSGPYAMFMLLHGLLAILAGKLTDRFGPRIVVTVCGAFFGLSYLFMSQIHFLWQLYLLYGTTLAIGASGSFVPLSSTIARLFVKRRGLTTGILASGMGIGTMIGPPVATSLISSHGWRDAYLFMGIVILGLLLIAAQFLRRNQEEPEQLRQGGQTKPEAENAAKEVVGAGLREVAHTKQFWGLCTTCIICGISVHTIFVHIVPHVTDLGMSPIVAASVMTVFGGANVAGRIAVGSASDRVGSRTCLIIGFVLLTLALFWLQLAKDIGMFYVFAIVAGLGNGGIVGVLSPAVAEFFGMKAHGVILGVVAFCLTSGGAIGPPIAGRIFDTSGSYHVSFLITAILCIAGIVLVFLVKPNRRPTDL